MTDTNVRPLAGKGDVEIFNAVRNRIPSPVPPPQHRATSGTPWTPCAIFRICAMNSPAYSFSA